MTTEATRKIPVPTLFLINLLNTEFLSILFSVPLPTPDKPNIDVKLIITPLSLSCSNNTVLKSTLYEPPPTSHLILLLLLSDRKESIPF